MASQTPAPYRRTHVPTTPNFHPYILALQHSETYAADPQLRIPLDDTAPVPQSATKYTIDPLPRLKLTLQAEHNMLAQHVNSTNRFILALEVLNLSTSDRTYIPTTDPTYWLHILKAGERALQTIQITIDARFPSLGPVDLDEMERNWLSNTVRALDWYGDHDQSRHARAYELHYRINDLSWKDTSRFSPGTLLLQVASGEACTFLYPDGQQEFLPAISGRTDEQWPASMRVCSVWAVLAMARCLSECYASSSVAVWGRHVTVGSFEWYWGP